MSKVTKLVQTLPHVYDMTQLSQHGIKKIKMLSRLNMNIECYRHDCFSPTLSVSSDFVML